MNANMALRDITSAALTEAEAIEPEEIGLPVCAVEVSALMQALSPLPEVLDQKTKTPILKNVLVAADAGRISFFVTNLDEQIVTFAEAEVTMDGQAAIDCIGLVKWAETLDRKAAVKLRPDGAEWRAQCGRARRNFKVHSARDLPSRLTVGDSAVPFAPSDDDRRRLLAMPAAIVSKNSWRHEFSGVSLRSMPGSLVAEAANPSQLVRATIAVADDFQLPNGGVVIPRHAADFVAGMKGEIRFNSYLVEAIDKNCSYVSKLLDVRVDSREHLIPESCENHVELDSLELIAALNRLGTVVSLNKSPLAQLWWDLGGNQLYLSTSQAAGEASDSVPVTSVGGSMTTAPIWPFLKLLEAIGDARIRLGVTSQTAAIKITLVGDDTLTAIQMPAVV
jgi:DNA polymerase III sliding clamp (beta) subunit (PCNA family)